MEEEEDIKSIKNQSLNPLLDTDTILLEFMNMEDKVWINTKTNVATSLAAEANSKKLELSPKQLIPEENHKYLDISTRIKQTDIQNQDLGIIKSK